jgi:thioredoxin-related protein
MNIRRHHGIRITLFFAALLIVWACPASAVSWKYDLNAALKEAQAQKKPVLADFYTDWCGWCTRMDNDTYGDRTVTELTSNFICVKVDGDKQRDQVAKYGVGGYPCTIFFDAGGNIVTRVLGYRKPAEFADILRTILKKTGTAAKKPGQEKKVPQNFTLTGIIDDPDNPKAIINDAIVGVGDSVNDAEVLTIKGSSVTIRYKGKKVVLRLE